MPSEIPSVPDAPTGAAAVANKAAKVAAGSAAAAAAASTTAGTKDYDVWHPMDHLSADEITASATAIRQYIATQTPIKAFKFVSLLPFEPPKAEVLAYLRILPTDGNHSSLQRPVRKAEAHVIDALTGDAYEALVRLPSSTEAHATVESLTKLPYGTQPSLSPEELCLAEEIIRKDSRVIAAAKEVGVEPEQLYADGWSVGVEERFEKREDGRKRRLQQCLLFARKDKDENLYAHPMDFFPVLDCNTNEVIAIDYPAGRSPSTGKLTLDSTAGPPEPGFENSSGRDRIPPPMESHDYLPDYNKINLRKDIKPLHVIQPEGVSFKMTGNQIEWQKWKFHIAFHPREGLVLSTVTYKDDLGPAVKGGPKEEVRPLFYRLSLAEMVVPYGEPAHPHWRKMAFDVGEYGLGILSNSLSLGCDCLGTIHYLDGHYVAHDGSPVTVKNAICIHEEDSGVLWKHTDYRPGGRAHAVRGRKLVVSFVATLANYEYLNRFTFHQDGTISLDIQLSGVLNLYVLGQGEPTGGFGTQVAPRINAQNHQHLFCFRVDPMLDGVKNTVTENDVVPLDEPTGSPENFAGNGFASRKTVLEKGEEAVRDWSSAYSRSWSVVNERRKHYASGEPVGYKIVSRDLPTLLCKPDSWVARRAPFAKHHFWVTRYKDNQLYPAGKHVPQTLDTPRESIENWAAGAGSIRNEDVVAWLTFGTTHVPRPEDFPVMPSETISVHLKPVGFFRSNPALDVPGTKDPKSKSAFATSTDEAVKHAEPVASTNGNGSGNGSCCA